MSRSETDAPDLPRADGQHALALTRERLATYAGGEEG